MRDVVLAVKPVIVAGVLAVLLGGCPNQAPYEYVTGSQGNVAQIGTPQVEVLTPASNLSLRGGSQVDVNWRAQAGNSFATVDVFIDQDRVVDSGNELFAYRDLPLDETSALVDTTSLRQGTYFIGVRVRQTGVRVASGYAPGSITIDQRPVLYFEETQRSFDDPNIFSARDNVKFDRSQRIVVTFDVAWQLIDPDTPDSQVTINLDPDGTPNGNEIELYATSLPAQVAAQALTPPVDLFEFSFDIATYTLEAGTYKILALVTDPATGQTSSFYAPGSIQLRGRLAGWVDLRDLDQATADVKGAVFEGVNPHDNAGSFVSDAADLDGDGFGDFIMMSQFAKPAYQANVQRTGSGEAYLIYGRQQRFSGVNNLNSTAVLFRAEIFLGPPEVEDPVRPSRGITSFTVLSDWDGDGVREFAFGIPFVDSDVRDIPGPSITGTGRYDDNLGAFRTGAVVIAAGSTLRPSLGFAGRNIYNLAAYGQRNRGPDAEAPCGEGFYGPNSFPGPFWRHVQPAGTDDRELDQLGCRIFTNDFGDQCGETISAYPNGAILISVPNRDPVVNTGIGRSIPGAGVVSLYFHGQVAGGFIWDIADDDLPHCGPFRYVLDDRRLFPGPGGSVLPASPGYTVDPDDALDPCSFTFQGRTPVPGNTLRVHGEIAGGAISNAYTVGDFNADGITDFVVGSPLSSDARGSCFIVFGRLQELIVGNDFSVEELGLPMGAPRPVDQRIFDGLRIVGSVGDRLGQSQADAGDFNNDGLDDILIGSPLANARRGGAAVFFGSRSVINLTQAEIAFDQIAARELGVVFVGEQEGDLAGARVANAGDVDGDGNTDILIAAPDKNVRLDDNGDGFPEIERTQCGVVYLIYGSPDLRGTLSLADVGTEKLPGAIFIGRQSGHHLGAGLGEQGDRAHGIASAGDVDGDGASDLLLGAVSASPRERAAAGEVYLLYGEAN